MRKYYVNGNLITVLKRAREAIRLEASRELIEVYTDHLMNPAARKLIFREFGDEEDDNIAVSKFFSKHYDRACVSDEKSPYDFRVFAYLSKDCGTDVIAFKSSGLRQAVIRAMSDVKGIREAPRDPSENLVSEDDLCVHIIGPGDFPTIDPCARKE